MKRMKRVAVLAAIISGAFAAGVYAEDVLQRVDAYLRPDFNLVLDGEPVKLSEAPLVYKDKSYLPLADLTRLLGANLLWREDTKTIYINSRINPEQKTEDSNQEYESIELSDPYSITLKYLGAEYPMLLTYNKKNMSAYVPYYREADVKRMGIDTSGLKKARERLTGVVYINEQELKKRWRKNPEQVYATNGDNYIINGEVSPKKIDALRTYIKNSQMLKYGEMVFYQKAVIIDKREEEDEYDYLYHETVQLPIAPNSPPPPNGGVVKRYMLGRVKLTKNNASSELSYIVNMVDRIDLQEEANKRGTR